MDLPAAVGLQASPAVRDLDSQLHFRLVNCVDYEQSSETEPLP